MFAGFPSSISLCLSISNSLSIVSWDTAFSSRAIGFIAATCIETDFAASSAPSTLAEREVIAAILFPA